MDLFAAAEEPLRIDRVRELVDEIEDEQQRLALSLRFFGAGHSTLADVAMEMGVSVNKVKEIIRGGLSALRRAVLEDDVLGPLFAVDESSVRDVLGALALGVPERNP